MLRTGTRQPMAFGFDALRTRSRAPKRAFEWTFEGLACADSGDRFGALQCFQRALETDIDCAEAWIGLSEAFLAMRDARRADACLQVAHLIRRRSAPEATA